MKTISKFDKIVFLIIRLFLLFMGFQSVHASQQHHPIPFAVLGDSDGHIYRDYVNGIERGGLYHNVTFQWTEILAKLRPSDFDLGELGVWGTRGSIAKILDFFGFEGKVPRKFDFKYNYAWTGARCASLLEQWPYQARWMASQIRKNPDFWNNGIVLIKIGINDIGKKSHMDEYAISGITPEIKLQIHNCMKYIEDTVILIRSLNNKIRFVIVGIADESSWPVEITPWRSQEEIKQIRSVLNLFDGQVQKLCEKYDNAVFMDDRTWYYSNWPDRDEKGYPQLYARSLGGSIGITNTQGDYPKNLALADGHASTVANGFWAWHLINTLNSEFGLNIVPLSDQEIANLADPNGSLGISSLKSNHK